MSFDIRAPFFRQNWVRVANASGEVIPPHSVVLANGTVTSSDGEPVIHVIKPNASSTQFNAGNYWVTGPFAIGEKEGSEGYACDLTTPGFVRYSGSTPSAGTIYGPKHDQFTLEQYYYGFGIIGGTTTSAGQNVVAAKWIGIHNVLGKTDAQSTKGSGTITVSVYAGAAGSEADTGMNISGVYNPFASVGANKWVWLSFTGGSYYITQTEKTSQSLLSEMRIKSGNSQIEGEQRAYFVDTVDTLAYDDKIPLTECP